MSCLCRYGGGPNGVCAFHRAEAVRARQDKLNAAKQQWIIKQIFDIAKKLDMDLDPLPKEEQ